ncbi:50S ribosomal protein L35, chloroplastic-like [Chenopodium quinoa]|uniref:50S ribosomal protein L35 n=1 Tax=Chenopodium quinoa TaxID=63459 RepID=A0A803M8Z7_CHEQI|nr:50S ribosomal protein L35, chloroplastic-like [Chenopodium quinoa]
MAMASATTTTILSLRTPYFSSSSSRSSAAQGISLTHFNKHFKSTLNLSSSHNISSSKLQPIILQNKRTSTVDSSVSTSFTVFAAKGYKMKTHKASAKRFRVTGKGKIVRRRAGKQHLLAKKNTKRKNRLSKLVQVDRSDYDNVIGALPYLKVNRKV